MFHTIASHPAQPAPLQPADPRPADLLRHGYPAWVRDLAAGTRIAFHGILFGTAGVIAGATVPGMAGAYLGPLIGAIAAAACVRGAWALTARDPGGGVEIAPPAARWAVRIGLSAAAVACGLQLLVVAVPADWSGLGWAVPAGRVLALAGAAGHFAFLCHLARVSQHIPNDALVHRARFAAYGFGLSLVAVAGLGTRAASTASPTLATSAAAYSLIVALVALLVYAVLTLQLLRRLDRALSIQADYASGMASRGR